MKRPDTSKSQPVLVVVRKKYRGGKSSERKAATKTFMEKHEDVFANLRKTSPDRPIRRKIRSFR